MLGIHVKFDPDGINIIHVLIAWGKQHQISCGDKLSYIVLTNRVVDTTCISMSFSHTVRGSGFGWLYVSTIY